MMLCIKNCTSKACNGPHVIFHLSESHHITAAHPLLCHLSNIGEVPRASKVPPAALSRSRRIALANRRTRARLGVFDGPEASEGP